MELYLRNIKKKHCITKEEYDKWYEGFDFIEIPFVIINVEYTHRNSVMEIATTTVPLYIRWFT